MKLYYDIKLLIQFLLQVKNKAPAEIQITAEQLLREAKERDLEILPPVRMFLNLYEFFYVLYPYYFFINYNSIDIYKNDKKIGL